MEQVLVTVICTAYNHEKYIRQALDSIFCQKTDFKYEVLINDDCSTDSTADIIGEYEKKYSNLRALYQKENLHSKQIKKVPILIEQARGEYIAFCECDDYFCDENKLQKQVDSLNANPECVACIHQAFRVTESGRVFGFREPFNKQQIMGIREIIPCVAGRLYSLNSLLCRRDAISDLRLDDLYNHCIVGDIPLALHLATKGPFFYLDEPMSAYRVNSVGSWSERIRKDSEKALRTMDNFVEVLNMLNEKTNGIYSDEIEERILSCLFRKTLITKDFIGFMNGKYRAYRRDLPVKQKFNFILKCVLKHLGIFQ